jgi:hypothetical protein
MTSKITLATAALLLMAFSSVSVVGASSIAPPAHTASTCRQAFGFAAPRSAARPDAYHYHGGPKSNDTLEIG